MKRNVLLKHLKESGCMLNREGSKHSIYVNIQSQAWAAVPRHPDINEITVKDICKRLGITTI